MLLPVQGRGGGGGSPGENFAGKISLPRKVAKFSPTEILAQQFHPSPQLQALCFLRRARHDYEHARANRLLPRCMNLTIR